MNAHPRRRCRVCPTPVTFAADEHGKLQVLDLKAPVYELLPDGTCRRVQGVYLVSHWSTCSHREEVKTRVSRLRHGGLTD